MAAAQLSTLNPQHFSDKSQIGKLIQRQQKGDRASRAVVASGQIMTAAVALARLPQSITLALPRNPAARASPPWCGVGASMLATVEFRKSFPITSFESPFHRGRSAQMRRLTRDMQHGGASYISAMEKALNSGTMSFHWPVAR